MPMRLIFSCVAVVVLTAIASSCGYDGKYRYTCQDPANWELAECKPPICEPTGNCSETLVWGNQNGS